MELDELGALLTGGGSASTAEDITRISDALSRLGREYSSLIGSAGRGGRSGLIGLLMGEGGASRMVSGLLDDFLAKDKSASDMLKGLERDLQRLGGRSFSGGSNAGQMASSLLGGGDLLSSLFPGFASGGSFTVGGAAGRDRNLVGLRLSRGEEVSIRTPSDKRKSNNTEGYAPNITFNYTVQASDADSFRRSQNQLQAEALRHAQRILKRNG